MKIKFISCIFGATLSVAKRTIRFMRTAVCNALIRNPAARIRFPNEAQKAEFAEMIKKREPSVHNIIGFIDGVAIPVKCPSDDAGQSAYYNGYRHDTVVNNVFAFGPNGKIIFACINNPGSWHDSQVCRPLIATVLEKIGQYAFCVDQRFPRDNEL